MRIVCPNCDAAYDVPEGLLTGRKAVSCARCGQEWRPTGFVAEAETLPEPAAVVAAAASGQQVVTWQEPAPAPPPAVPRRQAVIETPAGQRRGMAGGDWAIDRLMAAPAPPAGPGPALLLAWLASIVLILGLLGAGYVWRADVMAAWPPSTRLYAALGLIR